MAKKWKKNGSGASIAVTMKKKVAICMEPLLPICLGSVGYPILESPSKLKTSLKMLPPIVPKQMG